MAYIDYAKSGIIGTRKNISLYKKLNKNAIAIMAFSCSKTLALYGVRIGAQVCVSNDKENLKDFSKASKFSSRSKWSNATNLGANLLVKIVSNDDLRNDFLRELKESQDMLISRANIFLKASEEVGLKTLPFSCGFFVTIPCLKSEEAYQYLVKKNIHVIPMGKVLRVAICSVSLKECESLPKAIKEAIDNTK
jgi:aromatic-amino-acid transaminase